MDIWRESVKKSLEAFSFPIVLIFANKQLCFVFKFAVCEFWNNPIVKTEVWLFTKQLETNQIIIYE